MTQANFEVIKEPRGFIRCLQLVFAVVAFSTLANYSTEIAIIIYCKSESVPDQSKVFTEYTRQVNYPFAVSSIEPINLQEKQPCGITDFNSSSPYIRFLGDFSSDAEFFVFTGVISFIYSAFSLFVYIYYGGVYQDVNKRNPKIDFFISVVMAMFWLAGSAAWANGLTGLKWSVNTDNWLDRVSICTRTTHTPPTYLYPKVHDCRGSAGSYAGGTCAVLLGFLNFFLWTCNLWYLYKETAWFRGHPPANDVVTASEVKEEEEEPQQEEP